MAHEGFEAMLAVKQNSGTASIQLVRTRECARGELGRWRTEDLLATHGPCLTTDPRDNIYSLLNISKPDKPLFKDPRNAQYLVADHQLPVEALHTRVVRILIESQRDL
jgi:hypothetical protein